MAKKKKEVQETPKVESKPKKVSQSTDKVEFKYSKDFKLTKKDTTRVMSRNVADILEAKGLGKIV